MTINSIAKGGKVVGKTRRKSSVISVRRSIEAPFHFWTMMITMIPKLKHSSLFPFLLHLLLAFQHLTAASRKYY
jgi:hypothetical protein